MNKRLVGEYEEFVYKGERTPFSPGTLAVVIFCTTLLIIATFTKIDISHLWFEFTDEGILTVTKKYSLIPQVPIVLMSAALLGARFGLVVVFLYLLCGFFVWPVFGFGGGVEYVKSYFFGYILGFFAATVFSGRVLSKRFGFRGMLYASIVGVLAIHISGIIYSFVLSLFKSSPYNPDFSYIFTQIIYDIVFSFFVIFLAKPLKYILWIAMKKDGKKQKRERKRYIREENSDLNKENNQEIQLN